nr:hypothetical protein [Frankia sp. Cas4]
MLDVDAASGGLLGTEPVFPVVARLELDEPLTQLVDRAQAVLATQGRLRGLLGANQMVAADLSLPVVLASHVRHQPHDAGSPRSLAVLPPFDSPVRRASQGVLRPVIDDVPVLAEKFWLSPRGQCHGHM